MAVRQWRVWTILTLLLLLGGVMGDRAAAIPVGRDASRSGPASAAIQVVTADTAGDPVPPDFAAVMGYRPVRATDAAGHTWWVSPHGACSAPTGATRYDFSLPCRAHDLGYDLLRYAARTGHPLGTWARRSIDAAFGRALTARCATTHSSEGCAVAAAVYHGAVVANSWRQDWRAPNPEPALPWILLATALTLAPVCLNFWPGQRARPADDRLPAH